MNIVIVEDNELLANQIKIVLEKEGYIVDVFYDPQAFLNNFDTKFDLLILDINLPNMTGLELLNTLNELDYKVISMFMTSHTEIEFLREAYQLGCEDYIKKPFDLEELLIRIKRIEKLIFPQNVIKMGNYIFDLKNFLVKKGNKSIKITKKEALILKIFLNNIDKVISFDYLNSKVWNGEVLTNTITVSVLRIKRKLDLDNLENVREVGYIFHQL